MTKDECFDKMAERLGKIQKIADQMGYESQSRQSMEEMAELTVALNKFWRLIKEESSHESFDIAYRYSAIVEEIADVLIMMYQLQYLLKCEDNVSQRIDEKLDRQLKRIEEEVD